MKKPLTWIPWYIDSWIFGSSRHELSRAQRADFLDLTLLAGKDNGFIRANATTGYPIAQLAGLLCLDAAELEKTIEACVKAGKITRLENGILYITNWETFKLTDRWRREIELRGGPANAPSKEEKRRRDKSRVEERKGKRNTVPQKGNNVPQKGKSPAPTPDNPDKGTEEEGLLAIPSGLPFAEKDELIKRRGEIRRLARMIEAGYKHDGPAQLTPEILEQHKKAFNDRVRDFS
jgi:hypothetical protein